MSKYALSYVGQENHDDETDYGRAYYYQPWMLTTEIKVKQAGSSTFLDHKNAPANMPPSAGLMQFYAGQYRNAVSTKNPLRETVDGDLFKLIS